MKPKLVWSLSVDGEWHATTMMSGNEVNTVCGRYGQLAECTITWTSSRAIPNLKPRCPACVRVLE